MGQAEVDEGESDARITRRASRIPYDDSATAIEGIKKIVAIVKQNTAPAPKSTGRPPSPSPEPSARKARSSSPSSAVAARFPQASRSIYRPQAARDGAGGRGRRSPRSTQLVAEAGTGTGKTFAYLVPPCL